MFHSSMVFIARSKEEAESILEQFDQCGITWATGDRTTSFTNYNKCGTGYIIAKSSLNQHLFITYFTFVGNDFPQYVKGKIEGGILEAPIEVSEWFGCRMQTIDTIEDLI